MTNMKHLPNAIRFALFAGASAAAVFGAPQASAQAAPAGDQAQAQTLDRVLVTGSRLRRVEAETASPVFVFERQDIARSGAVTVGDFLQEIPSIAGAATNPQINNGGGTGASTVSLRGLSSARTLLLVNGRRLITQDVNAIPINMIERVEILKDGASAIYGSDAVAGVVNFILRSDLEGVETTAQYGISDRNDAETEHFSLAFGSVSESGSVMTGITYDQNSPIGAGDRSFSKVQQYLYQGEVFPLGSSRAPNGRYVVPRSVALAGGATLDANCTQPRPTNLNPNIALTRIAGRPGTSISDFRCFDANVTDGASDLFNFQPDNLNLTPGERIGLFSVAKHQITDHVEAYLETFFHNTRASFQIAPEPFDGRPSQANVPLSAQSVFNPFGRDITDGRLRLVAVGPREGTTETDRLQVNFGLKGDVAGWYWDVGALYGQTNSETENHGEINTLLLRNALGPSFRDTNGDLLCGTPGNVIAGCSPVDFFGPPPAAGTPGRAALDAIAPFFHDRNNDTLKDITANITGDLFSLPAGAVQVAAGFEYREETSDFQPDALVALNPLTNECGTSGNCSSALKGDFNVKEFYGELLIPILADAPFAKSLNVTVGVRHSDYNTFGTTTNEKYGLEWRPTDDILVRGTFAYVFRAPTVGDLFTGALESADTFNDPCNNTTTNPNGACNGVPLDGSFEQTDSQLNATVGGNPDLQPETGWVRSYGIVYDPSWAQGLSISVDVWDIHVQEALGQIGASSILKLCFEQGLFCDRFTRDSAGEVASVDNRTGNVGGFDTSGVDLGIKYDLRDTRFGGFRFSFDATYVEKFNKQGIVGEPSTFEDFAGEFAESSSGGEGNFAVWRALANVTWTYTDYEASWTTRYIHHFDEQSRFSGDLLFVDPANGINERQVGSQAYNDVQVGYNLKVGDGSSVKVTAGVDDLFDRGAPLIFGGFNGSTDFRTFDGTGRSYWLRVSSSF